MSFRVRLGLFFVLMVVLPMVAIGVLVVQVNEDSRAGKADAQLATGLATALSLYEDEVAAAKREAARILRRPEINAALSRGDSGRATQLIGAAARERGAAHAAVRFGDGSGARPVPARNPIGLAQARTAGGEAELSLSLIGPATYAEEVRERTGLDAAVVEPGGGSTGTLAARDLSAPEVGEARDIELGERTLRSAAAGLPGSNGARIALFADAEEQGFFGSEPRVAVVLGAFVLAALAFVALLMRTLQGQVAAMFNAARRIGEGDFGQKVPVIGRDEMAGLASEFNKMSERLAAQVDQLRRQRVELDRSIRRLGEAFAAGLDREALLGIVLETALGACEADYARIALADGTVIEPPGAGRGSAREAALAAEKRALGEGSQVAARRKDGQALAAPLRSLGRSERPVGAMSVGRRGEAFGSHDRDVFLYLTGQATASLENISTHERVSEQAITDELTGLPNHRAFRETMEREAARAKRFDHDLALLLLDIDDFKLVNDTHGHLQGDEVLRRIGRVLATESREIDEPARYGGEEFVVALPETELEGALEVAERIRARIEEEPIEMLDGSRPMYVSASFGVAAMPVSALSVDELVGAADKALYEAKAAGKNRVAAAPAASRKGWHAATASEQAAAKGRGGARGI